MSNYNHGTFEYFQGELFYSLNPPFNYVPTWISITTPPVTFLLGIIGMISIFGRGFIYPRDILRNTQLRFGFLLVACFILPILGVIMMNSTLYNGWRQMYFLYVPFCVLAVFGLHELVTYSKRIRFGEWIIYGLVGTGIIATVVSMILLHPFQHLYFNVLVDRTIPEHLKREYYMGDWGTGGLTVLKHLTEQHPFSYIQFDLDWRSHALAYNRWILPEYDRERIVIGTNPDRNSGDFSYIALTIPTLIHRYKAYRYETYNNAMPYDSRVSVVRSTFDIYQDGITLTYIKEPCSTEDVAAKFFLHVFPSDDADFDRFEYTIQHLDFNLNNNLDFNFAQHGAIWDGRCLAVVTLPDYDIARIRTGQYISGKGRLWEADFIPAKR